MIPNVPYRELNVPPVIKAAQQLSMQGRVKMTNDGLAYLDVDDNYIHLLQPLLEKHVDPAIRKPDYFGKKLAGAHITIFYPDEHKRLQNADKDQQHTFTIKQLVDATLFGHHYFVILVEAPTLTTLRLKHGLPERLQFKKHCINFHITIGRL